MTNVNRFKAILPPRRDARDREIDTLRAGLSIVRTADPMDRMCNVADRRVTRRNLDRTFQTLHLVEEPRRGPPQSDNNAPHIVGGPRRGLFKRYRREAERSPTVTMIA